MPQTQQQQAQQLAEQIQQLWEQGDITVNQYLYVIDPPDKRLVANYTPLLIRRAQSIINQHQHRQQPILKKRVQKSTAGH